MDSENSFEYLNRRSVDGFSVKSVTILEPYSCIFATVLSSDSVSPVFSGVPNTATVTFFILSPELITLPKGGRPAIDLIGMWERPMMPDTSPYPPPPAISERCAAPNASSIPFPAASQAHNAAAMEPAADIPNPCPTGRSFSMTTLYPLDLSISLIAALVIPQSHSVPSIIVMILSSPLSSRVTFAPLDSLIPTPLEPACIGSYDLTGWKKHVMCPGQKAAIIFTPCRNRGWSRRCSPWGR